ncbi:MAG: PAS domain S-box protein [Smithella sp.]|jgi:PAS domain S-box-containing protein
MKTTSKTKSNQPDQNDPAGQSDLSHLAEAIVSNAGSGIYIVSQGCFVYVSRLYKKLTGYTDAELIGVCSLDNIHPDDREMVRNEAICCLKAQRHEPYEYRFINKKNEIMWVLETITPIVYKGARATLGSFMDITGRKQAEEALQKSEEKYRNIFNNVHEGIYQATPEGRFILVNQAMAQILGYESPEELLQSITDISSQLYVQPDDRKKVIELIERQGFVRDMELQFYRKDKRKIWVSRTMQAVRDDHGNIQYLEGLIDDITDRKNSFDQLRKALSGTVQAIASLVETRDPYTAGHQDRVVDLARAIARQMGLSKEQIDGLRIAGKIHDIGKVSVPAELLSLPRKLSDLEFELIKTHAQAGYEIIKDIEFPWPIARIVLEHHERMDGSGYPNGLTGKDILPESRVLAVADVVEAMATHRPYRPALGLSAALEEITRNRGVRYDKDAVDACLCLFREKKYTIN